MKRRHVIIGTLVIVLMGTVFPLGAQIVDHSDIDLVATYPQSTLDAIGTQRWLFTHASVGANIISGMEALHAADPGRYQLDPVPVGYLDGELRVEGPPEPTAAGTVYECQRGNPGWASKFQIFDNSVRMSGWRLPAVDVVMDKLCFIDQNANAATYLDTMAALEVAFPTTRFVYTTMPLTTEEDSENILRNQYNEAVRAECAAQGKLLFDIADMEAHEPDGTSLTFASGGHTYQKLSWTYSFDGGHLNSSGEERIATGWYAVAAQLAINSTHQLSPGALEYLGAFRLPAATGEAPAVWDWGGGAMTYRPDGDPGDGGDGFPGSLFITGLETENLVAEVSIPTPSLSRDPEALPRADFLQPFADVRGGLFSGLTEIPRVGMEYLPAQEGESGEHLYLCWGQHYQFDLGSTLVPSHARCGLDLSHPQTEGAWWVGTQAENEGGLIYAVDDYLFTIPDSWAAAHTAGRALATGRFRDGGWSGMGPELFAIGPWLEGNPPAAGSELDDVPLIRYSVVNQGEHRLADYSPADIWNGGAWVTSSVGSAVIFSGTKGSGYTWYGFQTPPEVGSAPYDDVAPCVYTEGDIMCTRPDGETPCDAADMAPCTGASIEAESRGWWSSRFDATLLFYDPDDLAAVAEGTMAPWEPQPYATLDVDEDLLLPELPSDVAVYLGHGGQRNWRLGPAAYDRASGLLYALELFGVESEPVVHVWRVQVSGETPPEAGFTFSPSAPRVGETLHFTDTSTGSITSRSWSFGDGAGSTEQNPTHAYGSAGTYSVSLTVTGPGGSDTTTDDLTVTEAGGGATPANPGAFAQAVAAAAHTGGAHGSTWVTDLELHNPGTEAVVVNLFFLRADADNSAAAPRTLAVPAGGSSRLEDVVTSLFGTSGVGAILIGSNAPVLGSSRTYNDDVSGTFGQFIPAMPVAEATRGTELVRLIQLTGAVDFRTNIGALNLGGAPLQLTAELYSADGSPQGTLNLSLEPFDQHQENDVLGTHVPDGYAVIRATGSDARYLVYASVVDNHSNDPIFLFPATSPQGAR